jgi:hypothetical protein
LHSCLVAEKVKAMKSSCLPLSIELSLSLSLSLYIYIYACVWFLRKLSRCFLYEIFRKTIWNHSSVHT